MHKKKIDKLITLYAIVAVFVAVLSVFSLTFSWYIKTSEQSMYIKFAPPININIENEVTVIEPYGASIDSLIPGSKFAMNLGVSMPEGSSTAYVRAKMSVVFENVYDEKGQLMLWDNYVYVDNAITDSWIAVDFSTNPANPDIWYVCKTSVGNSMISREVSPGDVIPFASGTVELSYAIDNNFASKKIDVVMVVQTLQVVGVEDPLANGLTGAKFHAVWGN